MVTVVKPRQPVPTSDVPCAAPARYGCLEMATHIPCCSSHGKPLCCEHYCDFHFVEVNRCEPYDHQERHEQAADR